MKEIGLGIEVKGLSKSFGNVQALRDVSLTFEANKIYGLLGRNGAGKSTLLNIATNRIFADSGEVLVDGERVFENDRALGKIFMMSENNFYPDSMKARDGIRWAAEFYSGFDMAKAKALSELFGLDTRKKIKDLSTGYKSIFKIVVALSTMAPYLLLDEPVLGLDANHRDLFYKELLISYEEHPRCVVVSTHLIEEVSGLIEEIVIIKEGEILRNESCESLLAGGYTVSGKAEAVERFIAGKHCIGMDSLGGLKSAYILDGTQPQNVPEELEITKLDLQKLFIQLTNA